MSKNELTGADREEVSPLHSTAAHKRRGRRPSHAEHWTKVTVVLMDREIVFLDRLVADIRAANGAAISRAHVIRALIDALAESDLDLTASRSERELTKVFAERLRHRSPATPLVSPGPARL
jgi:hypothetical protein